MKRLTTEEQKAYLLGILKFFHEWCMINNINYTLACGTLLGAVRHKGFIPWDDDVDVYLLRKDYERFKAEFSDTHPYYKLHGYNIDGYPSPYCKLSDERTVLIEGKGMRIMNSTVGINIDIFAIDGVSEDEETFEARKRVRNRQYIRLHDRIGCYDAMRHVKTNIRKFWNKLLYKDYIEVCRQIDEQAYDQQFNNSKYYFDQQGLLTKGPYERTWFENYTQLPFEGFNFMVISNYHEYLTRAYGNYMELPPFEKRRSHMSTAFIKE